jgi:ATP-dependent DNA ligase
MGALEPPIQPMLSKSADALPVGPDWRYEPKWDGFRCLIFRSGKKASIVSRDQRPLNRYLPDIEPVLVTELSRGVFDGEIVVASDGLADFGRLQMRLHPAESRVRMLTEESPAIFIAFDLLQSGARVLVDAPLLDRRRALEEAVKHVASPCELPDRPSVLLSGQTDSPDVASAWFDEFEGCGIDGIVAKQAGGIYTPGKRTMLKIKRKRTADCVVGGYRVHKNGGIGSLLLGLYDDAGVLHLVGHCSNFTAPERRRLLEELQKEQSEDGFDGRAPGGQSRWTGGRERDWFPLTPRRVCEVTYDKMQGDRFRHAASFVRWRKDRSPKSCTFEQIEDAAAAGGGLPLGLASA